ncbi:MAG TPA: FkbM family methyltransferase [Planctomycetota bacterium]|nr:FkbM family methyltransferase [Planctomycetota bacterium]
MARPVNRLLRWLWSLGSPSRSTWFDSRRWRAVWNVNRLFMATPREERTIVQVQFAPSMRMELDLSRLTDVLAFCYGPGENEVGYACARLCAPDGVVADVGGNIGTTTLSFAACVPNGRVHVFEPSRDMLSILRRNLELSGLRNVTVHDFGLADAPSRGHLQVATAGNPGSAYFVDDAEHGAASEADEIEVKRLDDVLAGAARLDFVKIDVEGYELRVLRGASALLARHRPAVLFEVNEAALRRAGASGREVCDFLLGRGYRLRYLHGGRFCDYDPATMLSRKLHNVIAVAAQAAGPGA